MLYVWPKEPTNHAADPLPAGRVWVVRAAVRASQMGCPITLPEGVKQVETGTRGRGGNLSGT